MRRGKRYLEGKKAVDPSQRYELDEALRVLKELPSTKFEETVEIAIKLGVDVRKPEQMVRGTISLPKGTGRDMRVAVFAEGDAAEAAKGAGADEVGGEDLVKKVQDGWLDFDVAIAAPAMMRHVGKLGRLLGPRGLMPSPKTGTVTDDVATAVAEFKAGKIEYRTDASGNVHAPIGKKNFSPEDLATNAAAFIEHIRRSRPTAAKGKFIEGIALSSTMGPGIKLAVR